MSLPEQGEGLVEFILLCIRETFHGFEDVKRDPSCISNPTASGPSAWTAILDRAPGCESGRCVY